MSKCLLLKHLSNVIEESFLSVCLFNMLCLFVLDHCTRKVFFSWAIFITFFFFGYIFNLLGYLITDSTFSSILTVNIFTMNFTEKRQAW